MAVTDENDSPVEVHITKNRHFKFKGFAGVLHRERSWWFTELQGACSRTMTRGWLMDLFDKARQDMEAEVKKSFKWVVLTAVIGLVLLMFYVMVK